LSDYITTRHIAAWFGVSVRTVNIWIQRYPNFPKALASVDNGTEEYPRTSRMWMAYQEDAIRKWHASRPGPGAHNKKRDTE
jgi:hypothetical protein